MLERLLRLVLRALGRSGRESELSQLEKALRHRFSDRTLLTQALRHRSHAHSRNAGRSASNERMEFLGDSVLGMIVAARLFEGFPDLGEGDLTQLRSSLVRRETLAEAARSIDLGKWIQLSLAEERRGGRDRESILADAFEAVVGAAYLDGGVHAAEAILDRWLLDRAADMERDRAYLNPKNQLQELVQEEGTHDPPRYVVSSASGPAHERRFVVEVEIGDRVWGRGSGASKREAEACAARDALRQLPRESRMIPRKPE